MKVKPRPTHTRVVAQRITAPEVRTREDGVKIALLSYIAAAFQRHCPVTKEIFMYAAGSDAPGDLSTGLDRQLNHSYVIHKDENDKAVGLDIIPDRIYRSFAIPKSQDGVTTMIVRYDLGGAVAVVTQRPFNTEFSHSAAVIKELDNIISAGKAVTVSMRVGKLGRVTAVTENSVEIKLNARDKSKGELLSADDLDVVEEV